MIDWYLATNRILREIRAKSTDAAAAYADNDEPTARTIQQYLKTDYGNLRLQWEEHFDPIELGNLGRHIGFGDEHDYRDILDRDLPAIEERAEGHMIANRHVRQPHEFEQLLHPIIFEHAYQQFRNGHLRDSVLNSLTAVFDLIRGRTGIDEDGARLISQAFSLDDPKLIMSELESESGRNDQKGFIQIFQGAYLGIRNPKAHSLQHDLTEEKAAQYLIFASLLARRIDEARDP